jgi:TPR repeat protein
MLRWMALALALTCVACTSKEDDFQKARKAEQSHNTIEAIGTRKAAEQGDAQAQNNLGQMYRYGEGEVPKNSAEAMKWYRKATDQGMTYAQIQLGTMYNIGEGVPMNNVEAVRWYRQAADRGDAYAQYLLGQMFYLGEGGVPRDFVEAAKWYQKAADQGGVAAQFNIGSMYEFGEGVRKDLVVAYMWMNLAVVSNHVGEAKVSIERSGPIGTFAGLAESHRDSLERVMTPEQIAEAQRRSSEWKPRKQ